ncbi:MAG: glycoside hydrolase family 65 protein, partial [Clostridiales bacterium]|nr:glycoside hydrolase family 65 protein [Clostridiales bacterium]
MQKKQPIYPIEPWCVTEEAFSIENNYRNETTFALSNGYIGIRGTFEEGYDFSTDIGLEGNFINGFYDSEKIRYGEWNFGFPEYSQTLLNLPNLKTTEIYFGDERFDLRTGTTVKSRRTLDMRAGIVTRDIEWISPKGKSVHIQTTKLVSFALPHLMVNRISIEPVNFDDEIRLISILDADVENHTRVTNPLVDYGPFGRRLEPVNITAEDGLLLYNGQTKVSEKTMACGSCCRIVGDARFLSEEAEAFGAKTVYGASGAVTLDKFIAYRDDPPEDFIEQSLEAAAVLGFDAIVEKQKAYLADFWRTSDVSIIGDDAIQQGVRFNLFHMMQSAGRGGKAGMGAKGLSGEGYEGLYFWDTEIYVMPVFTHTAPDITKGLLDYRYHTLDAARARARELGHPKGALYPWRTINGHEASTYVPLGTAQYHINAD